MAYTFGAGTGDDITWVSGENFGGNGYVSLVCGWWRPTTLTATRGLWSAGNTIGAEIDATTDELRLRTDNTTDGQWTTTGVDLVVDSWKFLAFLFAQSNTGPTARWRVWAGSEEFTPTEVTVTNAVAPVGNFVANANFYIGNKGTGTLAFQGDVGDVGYITTGLVNATLCPFTVGTAGAISDTEAAYTYDRFIMPFWLGRGWAAHGLVINNGNLSSTAYECAYACTTNLFQVRRYRTATATGSSIAPTINGATWSQNGSPRPLLSDSPYLPARLR